ncbi:hypothetical protein MICAI_630005 [Microcystis sp. T1-4]|nr:hypothetical protein MICAI_630005 [Microcystis sp. T1-4]
MENWYNLFSQKKSIIENVLNSSFYNEAFSSKHLGECGYKGI